MYKERHIDIYMLTLVLRGEGVEKGQEFGKRGLRRRLDNSKTPTVKVAQ